MPITVRGAVRVEASFWRDGPTYDYRSSRDLLLVKRLIHFIFMHVSVNDYKYSILHEYDESYEMSPKCQDKKACDNHSTLRRYRTWRGITWRGFMIECSLQIARIPIIQQ